MTIRKPYVAGRFYPADKPGIVRLLQQAGDKEKDSIRYDLAGKIIIGAVLPHAGYVYCARIAVHFFEILKRSNQQFDTIVIVNPSHTGLGPEIALSPHDAWETPLGIVETDKELAHATGFPFAPEAHSHEHSGEVIVPMIQYYYPHKFSILPLTIRAQNITNARKIAEKIQFAAEKTNKKILFLASSDFSHYVAPEYGKRIDFEVIEKIRQGNGEKFIDFVRNQSVSMCGYGPVASLMEYSKQKHPESRAELLRFGHSGEIHRSEEVVDYATIMFYE